MEGETNRHFQVVGQVHVSRVQKRIIYVDEVVEDLTLNFIGRSSSPEGFR